jgi:hypothetical protein
MCCSYLDLVERNHATSGPGMLPVWELGASLVPVPQSCWTAVCRDRPCWSQRLHHGPSELRSLRSRWRRSTFSSDCSCCIATALTRTGSYRQGWLVSATHAGVAHGSWRASAGFAFAFVAALNPGRYGTFTLAQSMRGAGPGVEADVPNRGYGPEPTGNGKTQRSFLRNAVTTP